MNTKFLKIDDAVEYYSKLIPKAVNKQDWCFMDTSYSCGICFDKNGNYLEDKSFGLEQAYEENLVWRVG